MTSHRDKSRLRGSAAVLLALALVGAGALSVGRSAAAQDNTTQTQPDAQPPIELAPESSYRPGFIDAVGRWFEESRAKLDSQLKDAQDKVLDLHNKAQDNAKDAVGAIVRWPNTRIIGGRERCEAAPNGAPDCRTAAAVLCRGKGFADGKPFDTQAEDKCPSRPILSGRLPTPEECKTETFVMRAVCQ